MVDLIVSDLAGNTELLTGVEVTRKISDNNEKTITINIVETKKNINAIVIIKNQGIIKYLNDDYVVKKISYHTVGNNKKINITAYHKFYDTFVNNRRYETITGTFRINEMAFFIFQGSGYNYEIDYTDINHSVTVENFGDDSLLALMYSMLNKFGAEYEIYGTTVKISKNIGQVLDIQMRYKYNINDPNMELDSTDLRTYIRGFGKVDEETGEYIVTAEYTSPLAGIYGIKHAVPVRDERFTDYNSLLSEMKSRLMEYIPISLTLSAVDLAEMNIKKINRGDYVWCIIEPFSLDVLLRVVEIEDYSDPLKSPKFTFGSLRLSVSNLLSDWERSRNLIGKIVTDGIVQPTALPTEVLQSSQAFSTVSNAVQFTENGFSTSENNIKKSYIPDILFGNGKIYAKGYVIIDSNGVKLDNLPTVSNTANGLMKYVDKLKLDKITVTKEIDLDDILIRLEKLEEMVE